MATRKKSTLEKINKNVKQATKKVAKAADEYVVSPVSKALGLKKTGSKTSKNAKTKKAAPKGGSSASKSKAKSKR